MSRIMFTVLLVSIAAGCGVKKETHQSTLDALARCRGDLSSESKEKSKKGAKLSQLEKDLQAAEAERARTSKAQRKLYKSMKASQAELEALRKQRDAAQKRLSAYRDLNNRFRSLVDTGRLQVSFRNGQMVLKLPAGVLFASAKANLSRTGTEALTEILNVLLPVKDRRFMIAGHTDNQRIRGRRFASNWHLSTARAVSIVRFMVKAGFPSKNLSAAGFGEYDPVTDNSTPEGRQQNRRIEIILVPDLSELPNLAVEPS